MDNHFTTNELAFIVALLEFLELRGFLDEEQKTIASSIRVKIAENLFALTGGETR